MISNRIAAFFIKICESITRDHDPLKIAKKIELIRLKCIIRGLKDDIFLVYCIYLAIFMENRTHCRRVASRDSGMQNRKIEDTMLSSSPALSRTLLHKIYYYTIRSSSRAYPSVFCTTCSAGVSRVSTSFAQKWTLPLLRLHPCMVREQWKE